MNNWIIKSADNMKIQQDTATNPPSASHIDTVVSRAKDIGADYITCDVPYDLPNGGGDVIAQTQAWVDAAKKYGLNIFHRHSFCSDQGWYGVPQDLTNDRIQDTVNWIKAHPGFFQDGDIFTPKPEPQNCGIAGVNTGGQGRWSSATQFNQWLRDITSACKNAFISLGLPNVKVGYFGFDGFIVCGYGNPDWQGKSFLEAATVAELDNIIATDHYPELVGKPMTDFLSVFKQVWPGAKYFASEWGAVGSTDPVTQVQTTMGTLAADPIVIGVNYWVMSDNGAEALLDGNLNITPTYTAVQSFFTGSTTPTPTPVPPTPAPVPPTPTPPAPTPQPTPGGTLLGGLDIGSYAASIGENGAKLDATGRIWVDTKDGKPIDLTAVCIWQYSNRDAIAKQNKPHDPYSWQCFTSTQPTPTPVPSPVPAPVPTPQPQQVVVNITGSVTITTDATGKTSLKITATG